jgi:hypothetical protein
MFASLSKKIKLFLSKAMSITLYTSYIILLGLCINSSYAQVTPSNIPAPPLSQTTPAPAVIEDKNAPTVRILDPNDTSVVEEKKLNPEDFTDTATLQGLDKVTARVSPITLKTNTTSKFGNLEITLHRCWRAPADEEPESKAFIEISEQVPGEHEKQRFRGWMFASSPALSALEHPVYDITLISCTSSKDVPQVPTVSPEKILNKPLEIEKLQDLD